MSTGGRACKVKVDYIVKNGRLGIMAIQRRRTMGVKYAQQIRNVTHRASQRLHVTMDITRPRWIQQNAQDAQSRRYGSGINTQQSVTAPKSVQRHVHWPWAAQLKTILDFMKS